MRTAVWIIAICSVVRITQNAIQLTMLLKDGKSRQNAYSEFVASLKMTDKQFVKRMLEEFMNEEEEA